MRKIYKKLPIAIFISLTLILFVPLISRSVSVTFKVDMSEQTVSPLGVHIAGSFQGWDPSATGMTHTGNSVYAVTISFTEGEYIEYKFINGNAWGMDETVPPGCAANNNRFLTVPAQNTTLEAVCFGSCTICNPGNVDITFQVDMSNETVSPLGVHIAGSFQGWDPGATPMTDIGNNIYAITVELEIGGFYEYKFINGNAWGMDETVPPQCAYGWNRFITVPAVPTTLDAVCFGSCDPCGPPPVDTEVTFRVDMSNEIISPNGVHIAGGFQGWNPGATLMTSSGNNIFTYTTILPSGTYQEYKFINGTTWEESENVPDPCGVNNNRWLTVPVSDTILPAFCFGECDPCGPPPVQVDVTFSVDLANEVISPDGVHLAGSFQGWNPASLEMINISEDVYEVVVTFIAGTYIEFKYINGNTFDGAETVPEECGVDDGYGGFSRYLTVPDENTILPLVCFSSCDPCVPPMPTHDITFKVDMTYESVSPNGVHLAGTFQGWDPAATEMQPVGSNIYEITLELEEGSLHEYKFINGNTFDGAELVPPECAQNGNRYLEVPQQNLILEEVCFGSCEPCGPPPVPVDITFSVDLANEVVSPDGVHLAGSFQEWNPATLEMTNVFDDVYEVVVTLEAGTYIEFKYINGNTFDGAETVPEECGVEDGFGGYSRYLTVPDVNTILPLVCFSSCDPCPPPTPLWEITFRVDMTYESVSPNGVHLAGTFQGWDPAATEMQPIGSNIYEITLELEEGSLHEYKFINGNTFDGAELVPPECAQNGNRYLEVPQQNLILEEVCFGSCEPCGPPPVEVQVTFMVDMTHETVSPEGVHIAGSFQGWNPGATAMDSLGNGLFSHHAFLLSGTYIEYKFINGNAWGMDETVPPECANNNNRYLTVPETDTVLISVCYGSCEVCPPIGINTPLLAEYPLFYPNPASTELSFILTGKPFMVTIFSPDGKLLLRQHLQENTLDITGLKAGLYFIRLENETQSMIKKLIIQ